MNIKQIDEKLSIGPQILPSQVEQLADMGFKAIICNRPDGEAADQPQYNEIAREAEKHGIKASYLPVNTPMVQQSDADKFGELLNDSDGAVYAYCRSGMRSNALWSKSSGESTGSPWQALMGAFGR